MALHRIRDAEITKLAVVPKGANRRCWALLKAAAADLATVAPILKAASPDWRTAYIVVAEPGAIEDGGLGAAEITDVWDAEEIAKAAHSFLRNGGLTTNGHFMEERYGHAVESWIAPADVQIGGELVRAGSWLIGFEPTDEGRALIESGELGGVSIEGTGVREPVEVAKVALTGSARKALPGSAFALPGRRYPIHTAGHARAALARVARHGSPIEKVKVRAAVKRRYPTMMLAKFNPNHQPAGSPAGGQFAAGASGASRGAKASKGSRGRGAKATSALVSSVTVPTLAQALAASAAMQASKGSRGRSGGRHARGSQVKGVASRIRAAQVAREKQVIQAAKDQARAQNLAYKRQEKAFKARVAAQLKAARAQARAQKARDAARARALRVAAANRRRLAAAQKRQAAAARTAARRSASARVAAMRHGPRSAARKMTHSRPVRSLGPHGYR